LKASEELILLIDKHLAAVLRLADRAMVIEKGRSVWTGTSTELAATAHIRDQYLHL
jgi:branched-chain amino acid transport system ATP-binding protein